MSDKTRAAWISDKLHGRPVSTPPGDPVPQGQALKDHIASRLAAGPQPITDQLTPGDAVDQQANDAASIEEEARSRLDADALAGVDEGNPWAKRLLAATIKLVEIERARPAGV